MVVPVHNEEENLDLLVRRVTEVLDSTGMKFELLFVDDGSSDGSLEAIKSHAQRDKRIRFASFSRNFGHEAATSCGLRLARGGDSRRRARASPEQEAGCQPDNEGQGDQRRVDMAALETQAVAPGFLPASSGG